ncbi:hypothetical protein [Thauera humireducens]|uniref:hypothetical protein n=1 Tax=Thauera humireducens TaxID=1134435 RepID=UPI00311E5EE3
MSIDEMVARYIHMREKRSLLKREYDEAAAKIDEVMEKLEAALLKFFQDYGIDSLETKAGRAYLSTRSIATVADRDAFFGWVLAAPDERLAFVESRTKKAMVEQFKEANGSFPPGVTYQTELVVGIRRAMKDSD